MIKEKTICAQATAPGDAGIAIIRISGQDALKILKTVFRKKTDEFEPRHMYLGDVVSKGEAFDRALAVYFAAPHSYTGEDVCEIHTHGGAMAARLPSARFSTERWTSLRQRLSRTSSAR